jgi:predicted  nucleic acid-binding Zn-ribbon protein
VIPGAGTFFCVICGSQLSTIETEQLPDCPRCGGSHFRRDSIFAGRQDHSATTSEFPAPAAPAATTWLEQARGLLVRPGHYLAMSDDDGAIRTFPIERGWTRIGRSANADLRLDDPSVSRRHALVVAEPGKELRVLDDRSLNGVFVNGETIEWGPLHDGDELAIGRYSLYALKR